MAGDYLQFGYGIQRLLDANQRFGRPQHPVYYRYRKYVDAQRTMAAGMGFVVSASGAQTGYQDILVDPPCSSSAVSAHQVAMSQGRLRLDSRLFIVSATFVDAQVKALGLTDQRDFWNGGQCMGLFTENMLFTIESVLSQEVAGKTVVWEVMGNAPETR